MTVSENQITVACTPEELFDYWVDLRNELEWNPTAVSMEKVTEGPIGVGTRFLARWKGAPSATEVTCLEFERPRRWVHDNGGPIAATFTDTVEPPGRVAARRAVRCASARLVPPAVPGVPGDGTPPGQGEHDPSSTGPGAREG
jgi:hypothetical protein